MAGIFERIASQVAQKAINSIPVPATVQKHLPLARAIANGDIDSVLNNILSGALGSDFGTTPLLGGITLREAREIFDKTSQIDYAKKNLWCLSITDLQPATENPSMINFLATDVGYAPITIAGEAVRVGSGSFDTVQNSEHIEMRVTTMDDSYGSLKRWFEERSAKLAHPDGTFGLPVDYLFKIKVVHAFIAQDAAGAVMAKVDNYVMRPAGIEYDLSRREDAMQELQMSFAQFDTFTNL